MSQHLHNKKNLVDLNHNSDKNKKNQSKKSKILFQPQKNFPSTVHYKKFGSKFNSRINKSYYRSKKVYQPFWRVKQVALRNKVRFLKRWILYKHGIFGDRFVKKKSSINVFDARFIKFFSKRFPKSVFKQIKFKPKFKSRIPVATFILLSYLYKYRFILKWNWRLSILHNFMLIKGTFRYNKFARILRFKLAYDQYLKEHRIIKRHPYKNKRRVLYRKFNKKLFSFIRYSNSLTLIRKVRFDIRNRRLLNKQKYLFVAPRPSFKKFNNSLNTFRKLRLMKRRPRLKNKIADLLVYKPVYQEFCSRRSRRHSFTDVNERNTWEYVASIVRVPHRRFYYKICSRFFYKFFFGFNRNQITYNFQKAFFYNNRSLLIFINFYRRLHYNFLSAMHWVVAKISYENLIKRGSYAIFFNSGKELSLIRPTYYLPKSNVINRFDNWHVLDVLMLLKIARPLHSSDRDHRFKITWYDKTKTKLLIRRVRKLKKFVKFFNVKKNFKLRSSRLKNVRKKKKHLSYFLKFFLRLKKLIKKHKRRLRAFQKFKLFKQKLQSKNTSSYRLKNNQFVIKHNQKSKNQVKTRNRRATSNIKFFSIHDLTSFKVNQQYALIHKLRRLRRRCISVRKQHISYFNFKLMRLSINTKYRPKNKINKKNNYKVFGSFSHKTLRKFSTILKPQKFLPLFNNHKTKQVISKKFRPFDKNKGSILHKRKVNFNKTFKRHSLLKYYTSLCFKTNRRAKKKLKVFLRKYATKRNKNLFKINRNKILKDRRLQMYSFAAENLKPWPNTVRKVWWRIWWKPATRFGVYEKKRGYIKFSNRNNKRLRKKVAAYRKKTYPKLRPVLLKAFKRSIRHNWSFCNKKNIFSFSFLLPKKIKRFRFKVLTVYRVECFIFLKQLFRFFYLNGDLFARGQFEAYSCFLCRLFFIKNFSLARFQPVKFLSLSKQNSTYSLFSISFRYYLLMVLIYFLFYTFYKVILTPILFFIYTTRFTNGLINIFLYVIGINQIFSNLNQQTKHSAGFIS